MNLWKRIMLLTVCTALAVGTFAGCGKKRDYDLKIAVYLGGYGSVWADTLAKKFEEENNVIVDVEANPGLPSEIENRLKNKSDDDLIFSHGISWEKQAAQKKLTNLDDLYDTEVENGVKFRDRVGSDFLSTASFNGGYYKVPWTNGCGGLVYNKKMFEDHNWPIPTVYANPDNENCDTSDAVGLTELCAKIYSEGVTPFVWSSETYYWDYVVFDWWVQLMGIEALETYKKVESANQFDPTAHPEQMKALQAWTDLVAKHPEYSVDGSEGKQFTAAQMEFVNGHAAMMPNAQWIDMQMSDTTDSEICEMAIMRTPYLADAKKDEAGHYIPVSYAVGAGDSIIIPAAAPAPDLAKKFLLFMAREENIRLFTEKTRGVMLAMDYTNLAPNEDASQFTKDVYEINTHSKKFNLYSQSPMVLGGKISIDWPYEGVQHYATLYAKPDTNLKKDIFQPAYKAIQERWSQWESEL